MMPNQMNTMLTALKSDREFYVRVVEKIDRSITSLERAIHDEGLEMAQLEHDKR